jgi:hypothetical protein
MLRNTTNIPDRLVAIAAAYALASLEPKPELACIRVKNKARGKVKGQWGWYYHQDREVVVIVPRKISHTYISRLKFSRKNIEFSSRGEFLVMLLAHEIRHAWQYNNWTSPSMAWRLERTRVGKYAREVDAELYELAVLERWKKNIMPMLLKEKIA